MKRIVTALMPSFLFRCFSLFLPRVKPIAHEKRPENCVCWVSVSISLAKYNIFPSADNGCSREKTFWQSDLLTPTAGRLYVGRWNERVRAKRCDAVDWGLLKQGDSTYLHSNLDFERNYTKLPSMWIRNFFYCIFVLWQWGKVSFSGMKQDL